MLKIILAVAAFASAVPALADTQTRVVRYDDLNLSSPAGLETLERRIDAAARRVCTVSDARVAGPGEFAKSMACVAKAKAGAREQMARVETDQSLGG